MATLTRSIHFYQMVNRFTDAPFSDQDIKLIMAEVFKACNHKTNSYLKIKDGECRPWLDSHKNLPIKIRFGTTRKVGIPQLEAQGNFRHIDMNHAIGEGINDLSHLIIFKRGVVGHEFNFFAPRLSKLSDYIHQKTKQPVKFVALLNSSAAERLANLRELTTFTLKVKSDRLDELKLGRAGSTLGGFKKAVDGLSDFSKGQDLEVTFSTHARSTDRLADRVKQLASKLFDDHRDQLKKMQVKGINQETGNTDEIDFLKELLVAKKSIVRADSRLRTVDGESAYSAISSAYSDLQEEIHKSIGI